MSNRDKFLLVIIGIAGVILLPYFLYIKDARDRVVNLDNEITQLNARYQQLLAYEEKREFYLEGTEENIKVRDEIIAMFPADIIESNYVMYLLNAEYSESMVYDNLEDDEEIEDLEEGEELIVAVEPTIRFTEGKFTYNIETPISSSSVDMTALPVDGAANPDDEAAEINPSATQIPEGQIVETEYVALQNNSTIKFICYDHLAVNHLLEYIMEYEDPMIYREITFKHDAKTGHIEGDMVLAQYAVLGGEDREFQYLDIVPEIEERGNEHYGIFGPNEMLIKQEIKEEAERAEEEANGVNVDDEDEDED